MVTERSEVNMDQLDKITTIALVLTFRARCAFVGKLPDDCVKWLSDLYKILDEVCGQEAAGPGG